MAMNGKNPTKQLHERLDLYVNDHFYVFQPSDNSPCLTVNRVTGVIKLESSKDVSFLSLNRADRVYGILGLLSLTASDFIVILVGRDLKGEIFGSHVYQATDFKVLPLAASPLYQHPVESHLLAFVRSHLFGGTFLFSYTWDLTRTLQAQRLSQERDAEKALWEVADDRFFWNKFLQSRFIDITNNTASQDLGQFILPVVYGTFDICDATIRSHNFRFGLLSRRSRYRAGTRYFTRGIDEKGNVANFNETEQIVILQPSSGNSSVLSFVQIRGSVPLFWTEVNNLRYIPDLQIMELPTTLSTLRIHLQNQIAKYGALHIINLVNQKREKPIKDTLEHYMSQANIPHVSYDYFDFNRECRKMQWHRIETLIDRVQGELIIKGYFHDNSGSLEPLKLQRGVFRTNCMDNLDRTNVVQSSLAKWTLTQQFRELGILKTAEDIDQFDEFMMNFRNIWADHADSISRAYSGTGALKTDFTRTGKRTIQGLLQDGLNSVMRYIKNNYFDGARQDAFDIFTGSWVPRTGPALMQTLLVDNRPLHVRSIPYILSFSIFMVFAGLTLPRTSDYSLVYYFSIWLVLIVFSLGYIFLHSVYYVAWPRLNPPTEAIYYNGPGFRSSRRGFGWVIKQGGMAPVHRVKFEEVEMGNDKKRID